jgi:ABC-type multidrug transport system ATPase subunit
MLSSVLLSLDGITKKWNGRPVLHDVDLDIRAGAVTGVAGGNGAGKTTLLRIASGMITGDSGETRFRGVDIARNRASYQRSIGLLSAGDRGLYARLTVRQNLDIWGGMAGLPRQLRRDRAEQVISEFDLGELADRRVDRMSMGQRQRVRLSMTFLHEPVVVFLDEPRTSLDEEGVALLAEALERLVSRGGAALWVAPDANEPLVGDHWLLRDGRLEAVPSQRPLGSADPVLQQVVGA